MENGKFRRVGWKDLTAEGLRQTKLDLVVLQRRLAKPINLRRRQRDVELPSQAFSNLSTRGASLRTLRTEVVIYKDDTTTPLLPLFGCSVKLICASSAYVSHTLFASLVTCDLPIRSLDLFNNMRMLRWSLSHDGLDSVHFVSGRLDMSVGHLAELSWSISDKIIDQSSDEKSSEEVTNGSGVHGLRSLLQTCSSIRKLDLAYFTMEHGNGTNAQCGCILRVLGESSLRCLQHLTLQGFEVTEHELLALLQRYGALRSLSLRYIKLEVGSFKPILDYCTLDAAMEELWLDSLFEPNTREFECDVIQFEPPWVVQSSKPETPPAGYPSSRAFYRRPTDNAESHQIRHHRYEGRTSDSISMKAWRQDLENQFGPLSKNGKPSCFQPYVPPERLWRY
jgi:hypothetical protein